MKYKVKITFELEAQNKNTLLIRLAEFQREIGQFEHMEYKEVK